MNSKGIEMGLLLGFAFVLLMTVTFILDSDDKYTRICLLATSNPEYIISDSTLYCKDKDIYVRVRK